MHKEKVCEVQYVLYTATAIFKFYNYHSSSVSHFFLKPMVDSVHYTDWFLVHVKLSDCIVRSYPFDGILFGANATEVLGESVDYQQEYV